MNPFRRSALFAFATWPFGAALAADPSGSNTGGVIPTGPAGGDLTGTFPNPTVALIGGVPIASVATTGSASSLSTGTLSGSLLPALGGDVIGTAGTTTLTVVKSGGVAIGPAGTATIGQIPGSNAATAAVAGNIGEFTSLSLASGSAFSISTGAATGILALPLSAGDWDVWGSAVAHSGGITTVFTSLSVGISTASNTALPSLPSPAFTQIGLGAGLTNIADTAVNVGPTQILLASAGTAFLNGKFAFATSTASVYGVISARRRR